jgi:hypothetical protein
MDVGMRPWTLPSRRRVMGRAAPSMTWATLVFSTKSPDGLCHSSCRTTMSASAADISQLSEEQQLALQQVTSVTDQDLDAALALLQRCQWNAQVPTHIPPSQSSISTDAASRSPSPASSTETLMLSTSTSLHPKTHADPKTWLQLSMPPPLAEADRRPMASNKPRVLYLRQRASCLSQPLSSCSCSSYPST